MDLTSVMTPNPATCSPESSLRDVALLMVHNDCGEIPVVDPSQRLLGVLTDRDIVVRAVAEGRDVNSIRVSEIMTTPVTSVTIDAGLSDVIEVMETRQIRRVPVIDTDGRLVGIIAQADIALTGRDKKTGSVVEEVSRPNAH